MTGFTSNNKNPQKMTRQYRKQDLLQQQQKSNNIRKHTKQNGERRTPIINMDNDSCNN